MTRAPQALRPALRPLLIIPGYGMNAFIFGYHPRGTSMERSLAEAGFEVWSANLRNQGPSRRERPGAPPPSLRAFAEVDVPTAIAGVLARTKSRGDRVDAIGASLGGSLLYAHMALQPDHRVGSVVAIGSPLRWVQTHPLVRVVFGSRTVASSLRMRGTRTLATLALPFLARVPSVLSIYMNTNLTDVRHARELTKTIEDPHPRVNADIAKWIAAKDMVLRGTNVTTALARERGPVLVVLANRDGIVPVPSAASVEEAWGDPDAVDRLEVGDDESWYAHADLFVGDPAPQTVFAPMARWLAAHNG